jgi:2,3-bisphosphoglycerate-independent phosphoglycerate mutase
MNKKVVLLILDGWGLAADKSVSAIDAASTPFMDSLYKNYPWNQLQASGLFVGLPNGQMGNSEVGHMNIGAGRVVYQDLVRVNKAIEDGELAQNEVLLKAFETAKQNGKALHFIGLLSDGGVHSHIDHLKALCHLAESNGVQNSFVHAFTDGRDTDPKAGINYLADLEVSISGSHCKVASVIGRYYAMDRDKRWERVKKAYDCLLLENPPYEYQRLNLSEAIQDCYNQGITDEFLPPLIKVDPSGKRIGTVKAGDVVVCFNFRTDRGREITMALTQQAFPEFEMEPINLHYITLTQYDATFKNVNVVFYKDDLKNTLGEVLSAQGKKQIRIAETEKYPHVTFFFSGGREEPFVGEKRLLCPSPKVATYDLKPEMSAFDIRNSIVPELQKGEVDFVCLNFANPDMVGHTGVFEAAVKACEVVDICTRDVVNAALENDYTCIIIADHGNSDKMRNEDGSPNTAHTTNPVPFILVDKEYRPVLKSGKLGDLAPTILYLMGLHRPAEMTGDVLLDLPFSEN